MAERLALPTSLHGVAGSNPAGGEILPEPKRRFIAQSLSCSSFHRLEVTEILLKGRKTLTHPSMTLKTYEILVNASVTVKGVGGISSCNGGKLEKPEGYNCFFVFVVSSRS